MASRASKSCPKHDRNVQVYSRVYTHAARASLRHALPRPLAIASSHQLGRNARKRQVDEPGAPTLNVPPVSTIASVCSSRRSARPTSTGDESGAAASAMAMIDPVLPLGRGRAMTDVVAIGRTSVCGAGASAMADELGLGADHDEGTSVDGGLGNELRQRRGDALFALAEEAARQDAFSSDAGVVRSRRQLLADVAALAEVDC